ncbi:GNAT family N-acetyltransferase [Methanorbis furvi]|uniref:N-acetyltransferase domain-containing protein n=1 Tax=Methanorbis furvi TaxID=3028299 RepID=A0AAE4MC24_9EURY|nr:hypothetical protein [Methanocorpusculaceae archaeon Ag1]
MDIGEENRQNQPEIKYLMIRNWQTKEIIDLYRAGGWWEMGWNPGGIAPLIRGSFLFIIALDSATGSAVGMGRIIADGSSDGYIQDVAVLPSYRNLGIGSKIAEILRSLGQTLGLSWLGLIAAPEAEGIYKRAGFSPMERYTPMNLEQERPNRYHDTQ